MRGKACHVHSRAVSGWPKKCEVPPVTKRTSVDLLHKYEITRGWFFAFLEGRQSLATHSLPKHAFLPPGFPHFESAITAQNHEFKAVLIARLYVR